MVRRSISMLLTRVDCEVTDVSFVYMQNAFTSKIAIFVTRWIITSLFQYNA